MEPQNTILYAVCQGINGLAFIYLNPRTKQVSVRSQQWEHAYWLASLALCTKKQLGW